MKTWIWITFSFFLIIFAACDIGPADELPSASTVKGDAVSGDKVEGDKVSDGDDDNDSEADDDSEPSDDDLTPVDNVEVNGNIYGKCYSDGAKKMELFTTSSGQWKIVATSSGDELEFELHPADNTFKANVRLDGNDAKWLLGMPGEYRGECEFWDEDGREIEPELRDNGQGGFDYWITVE